MTRLKKVSTLVYIFFAAMIISPIASAEVALYDVYELNLTTTNTYANPYTDVTLSATFTGPTKTITIEGFWDGGTSWKIRMAPTEIGTWRLTSILSNDTILKNSVPIGTSFVAHQPTAAEIAQNEVLRNGFIKVNPDYPHSFMHADGTPFFFMGITQWRAMLHDFYRQGTFQQMVDAHSVQGFNVFNVADLEVNNDNSVVGYNEGGKPFSGRPETDNILNPEFFKWVDLRIAYMNQKNIRPMILIGSPDRGLTTSVDFLNRLQRYIIARWAAYDVIWFGVKEYQEMNSINIPPPYSSANDIANAIGDTVERYDPYQHPTSIHPGGDQSSSDLGNPTWLDFHALQRGGGSNGASSMTGVTKIIQDYTNYPVPVMQTEAFYDGPAECVGPNGYSGEDAVLEGIWAIQMHGGYNAGYRFMKDCNELSLVTYLANINTVAIGYHTRLFDFFTTRTDFTKLVPKNNIITTGSGWALSQPGKEYVVYLGAGGTVGVDLSLATSTLSVEWYNPRTGSVITAPTTTGGATRTFTAPQATDWVLHIFNGIAINQPPKASFTVTPDNGEAPLSVSFDASASGDSDGTIVSYSWNFGDGGTGSGPTINHIYTSTGVYTSALTVTDDTGNSANFQRTITANGAPVLTSINITPANTSIAANATRFFFAEGLDQYNNLFVTTETWSTTTGGSINPTTGEYTAGNLDGNFIVSAKSGNISATANVTVDAVAPSLSTVTVLTVSILKLQFDEAIDTASAAQKANYSIMDENGNVVVVTDSTNTSLNSPLGRVELSTGGHNNGINYTITVQNVRDVAGNLMSPMSLSYTYIDQTSQSTLVSNIVVQTSAANRNYELAKLAVGSDVYIDRNFTYDTIPAQFQSLDALRTANDDKAEAISAFLRFTVSQAATVYVAYDNRIVAPAGWLASWQKTGETIVSSDTTLDLYKQDFAAGEVSLGGNERDGFSMYTVVVSPLAAGTLPPLPVAQPPIEQTPPINITPPTAGINPPLTGQNPPAEGDGTTDNADITGTGLVDRSGYENAGAFSTWMLMLLGLLSLNTWVRKRKYINRI